MAQLFTCSPSITSQTMNNMDNRLQQPHCSTQWEEVISRDSSRISVSFKGKSNQLREPAQLEIQPRYSWCAQIRVFTLVGIICTNPIGPKKRYFWYLNIEAPLIPVNVLPVKQSCLISLTFLSQDTSGAFVTLHRSTDFLSQGAHVLQHSSLAFSESSVGFRGNSVRQVWDLRVRRAPGRLCCRQKGRVKSKGG